MACFHDSGVQISHFCPYEKGTPLFIEQHHPHASETITILLYFPK
jgi:hypothetical protein